jgi:dienelactone hydrolase
VLLIVVVAALATVLAVRPYVRGASLVVRAADVHGWIRSAADLTIQSVEQKDITIPTRYGSIPGREYRPTRQASQAVLLTTGVHALGIVEPRLVRLARELSASGVIVVTPELPGLKRYQLTSESTDIIEDAGVWLSRRSDLGPIARPALMGISFSGGLSVVAAGRPALRDRLAYVFSFGGHADLPRVLGFLAKDEGPERAPHDYGVAVLLLNVVTQIDGLVPAAQVAPLRQAIETFLWASRLTMVDPPAADQEFERARQLARALPEPSATLMKHVNDRDVNALGPALLPYLATLGHDPALSPERSPAPAARVYLLHGQDDTVIPAAESRHLARYLEGKAPVTLLVSGLLIHADAAGRTSIIDGWKLVAFWTRILKHEN